MAVGNGMNNNLNIGAHTFIQLGGANGAFSISGIAGGTSGKIVIIYNSTGQAMTLSNNDPLSVVGNRIFNGTNQNYVTPNGAAFDVVTLIYSTAKNGWLIVSHN
jgi:hypothetical protein